MKIEKIINPNENSFYYIFSGGNFEYKNPIKVLCNHFITPRNSLDVEILTRNMKLTLASHNFILKRNLMEWFKHYKMLDNFNIPVEFLSLLANPPKKVQQKLLKGLKIDADLLAAILVKSFHQFGYSFSRYRFEHMNNSNKDKIHPELIHVENDELIVVGETNMTKGELKAAVNYRHVVIANFLDNDDGWLCFFITYRSIKGQEKSHANGSPHFHFISDKWGLPRQYVLDQLSSEKYSLPSLPHIEYIMH